MKSFQLNGFTYVPEETYKSLYAFLPQNVFYSDNKVTLNGGTYFKIKTPTYERIIKDHEEYQEKMKKLNQCAELNNKGIEFEKSGDIPSAIAVYEENISGDCYPATHSFDRLMILYRKAKDYENEIRIIKKAIKVLKMDKYRERLIKANELLVKQKQKK